MSEKCSAHFVIIHKTLASLRLAIVLKEIPYETLLLSPNLCCCYYFVDWCSEHCRARPWVEFDGMSTPGKAGNHNEKCLHREESFSLLNDVGWKWSHNCSQTDGLQ